MRKTSHMENSEPILETLLSELRFHQAIKLVQDNYTVADLGCGYHGNLLKRISNKIKIGIGYDVKVVKTGYPKNIQLRKVDLNKKFSNKYNYFNLVTALAVLEHVENPENFLKQIKAMLKKGGVVIFTTPHKNGKALLEFLSYKLGLVSKDEISDHKNYFDERTLKSLIKTSGLKLIRIGTFEFGGNLLCVAKKI